MWPQYISIFDHAGQPVQSLVNCNTWDGRDQNGRPQAPGIYLYQVSGHGFTVSGKLVKAR